MYPQVDIQKIRDRYFNYCVSMGDADECYARQGLRSIAECVHDAATALGQHFPVAVLSYEGRPLGRHQVADMEHRTVALVQTLLEKLDLPEQTVV